MTTLIAVRDFKVDTANYLPGDKFDTTCPPVSNTLGERQIEALKNAQRVAPLTRETYQIAMARRAPDMPKMGRGFTAAWLIEAGIIDKEPDAAAPAPAPDKPKASKPKGVVKPRVAAGPPIAIGPFWLIPYKSGNAVVPTYDLVNDEGALLHTKQFRSTAKAQVFVDELLAKAGAAKAGTPQESQDDGHLQREPEQPGQPGSPEDR